MTPVHYVAAAILRVGLYQTKEANFQEVYLSERDVLRLSAAVLNTASLAMPVNLVPDALEKLSALGAVTPMRSKHASTRWQFEWNKIRETIDRIGNDDEELLQAIRNADRFDSHWLPESYENSIAELQRTPVTESNDAATSVPAADRYVALTDNEKDESSTELAALKDQISQSNEGDEESKIIALSEIAAFEAALIQNRISDELIERFVHKIISWITTVFTASMVSEIAKRISAMLLKHVANV